MGSCWKKPKVDEIHLRLKDRMLVDLKVTNEGRFLPFDVLANNICHYLTCKDLNTINLVDKQFYIAATSDVVWNYIAQYHFRHLMDDLYPIMSRFRAMRFAVAFCWKTAIKWKKDPFCYVRDKVLIDEFGFDAMCAIDKILVKRIVVDKASTFSKVWKYSEGRKKNLIDMTKISKIEIIGTWARFDDMRLLAVDSLYIELIGIDSMKSQTFPGIFHELQYQFYAHGKVCFQHENGDVEQQTYDEGYVNGKAVLKTPEYTEERNYCEGVLEGPSIVRYNNGDLETRNYVDGQLEGIGRLYSEHGNKQKLYLHGQLVRIDIPSPKSTRSDLDNLFALIEPDANICFD